MQNCTHQQMNSKCINAYISKELFQVTCIHQSLHSEMSRLMTKPTKWHVRQAKTQISLGICPVWSESSLSAWRKLGSSATRWVHSEDSDQPGWMPRLIWVFAGRISYFVGFVMLRLKCFSFHLNFSDQLKLQSFERFNAHITVSMHSLPLWEDLICFWMVSLILANPSGKNKTDK